MNNIKNNIYKKGLIFLKNFFKHSPSTKEALIEILRNAENKSLLDADALLMIEGALDVSIRPECIELVVSNDGNFVVKECIFYGHDQVISFQNNKGEVFRARSLPNVIFEQGDRVNINISEVTTFPSKT